MGSWPGPTQRMAVVIPTLNEDVTLGNTLRSLQLQTEPADRVVVSDGGSTDRTVAVAQQFGATVLAAPRRGRGCQIAYAVERLDEDVILVAHADMTFPGTALAAVRAALSANRECPGGCLGHRFDQRRLAYRVVERIDRRRAQRRGISFGDQAQFFRRDWLSRCGGFPDQSIMEDLELSRRLRVLGRPIYLGLPVTVSSRYFDRQGYLPTIWRNVWLRWMYRLGGLTACQRIYDHYYSATALCKRGMMNGDR